MCPFPDAVALSPLGLCKRKAAGLGLQDACTEHVASMKLQNTFDSYHPGTILLSALPTFREMIVLFGSLRVELLFEEPVTQPSQLS